MKQLFVVRGSEDGVLGVFTSRKKALKKCVAYVQNSLRKNSAKFVISYFDNGDAWMVESGNITANIEQFTQNQY